jgi:hypothetical protein
MTRQNSFFKWRSQKRVSPEWPLVKPSIIASAVHDQFRLGSSYTDFDVTFNSGGITTSAVPEPSQAVASFMLLGCGALVFMGRRLLKKQAQ